LKYNESLTLKVFWTSPSGTTRPPYVKKIDDRKKSNSWFYYKFEKDITLFKGFKCSIQVQPHSPEKPQYQAFSQAQILSSLSAQKGSAITNVSLKNTGCGTALAERKKCPRSSCIIKSISYILGERIFPQDR